MYGAQGQVGRQEVRQPPRCFDVVEDLPCFLRDVWRQLQDAVGTGADRMGKCLLLGRFPLGIGMCMHRRLEIVFFFADCLDAHAAEPVHHDRLGVVTHLEHLQDRRVEAVQSLVARLWPLVGVGMRELERAVGQFLRLQSASAIATK